MAMLCGVVLVCWCGGGGVLVVWWYGRERLANRNISIGYKPPPKDGFDTIDHVKT